VFGLRKDYPDLFYNNVAAGFILLVPKLPLGNPLLMKLCFAIFMAREKVVEIGPRWGRIKRSRSFSSYGVPKQELGNELSKSFSPGFQAPD
jgi:hypothetical protein